MQSEEAPEMEMGPNAAEEEEANKSLSCLLSLLAFVVRHVFVFPSEYYGIFSSRRKKEKRRGKILFIDAAAAGFLRAAFCQAKLLQHDQHEKCKERCRRLV